MVTTELTRRNLLNRAIKLGVALVVLPGGGLVLAQTAASDDVVLDGIEGFATAATVHLGELVLVVQSEAGPAVLARGLSPSASWRVVTGKNAFPTGAYIRSLFSWRDQLLALGSTPVSLGAVEFVIEDDESWSNPEDPDLQPYPPGTLIREERWSIEPLLSVSSNASEWKTFPTGVKSASLAGAFAVEDRVLVLGESFDSPVFSADSIGGLLIASSDLAEWQPMALAEEAQPIHGHYPAMAGLPVGGGLVIASDPAGKRLLETNDGVSWVQTSLPPGTDSLQPMGVAPVSGGVALAGIDGDVIRVWIRNGPQWRELNISSQGHMYGLASIESQLLLLGEDHDHTPLVEVQGGDG